MRHRLALAALALLPLLAKAQTPSSNALIVAKAALAQVGVTTKYDPSYARLPYPNGDIPRERGVCADVVVRAFRAAGADLQTLVHEDMKKSFPAYPQKWQLKKPDPNIDHRRVLNLETFFTRAGKALPVTRKPEDYWPGDVVSWRLDNGLPHIGVVATRPQRNGRPLVVHNIGAGARQEDVLFDFKLTGHFRYFAP
jgi:uncharacterized protein YijF (DUF1287 family)